MCFRFFLAAPSFSAWGLLNAGAIELDLDYRFFVDQGAFIAYCDSDCGKYLLETVVSNMDVIGYMEW